MVRVGIALEPPIVHVIGFYTGQVQVGMVHVLIALDGELRGSEHIMGSQNIDNKHMDKGKPKSISQ